MGHCSGNCGSCAGCGRELELTEVEMKIMGMLSQIPFLPAVRKMGEQTPVFPEEPTEQMSLALQCLEKKALISLDYDKPIRDYPYGAGVLQGSFALTARGQAVLELMEYQGFTE